MTRINRIAYARRRLVDNVNRLKRLYAWADQRSGGSISILRRAAQRFSEMRAADTAASVAFWAFFALFPLLLFLVAIGSFVLTSEQVYGQVVNFAGQIFPGSQDLIQQNIQQVLTLRGPVGLIGLVGLVWAASGAFDGLSRHINQAWSTARPRSEWQYRLLGLGMIAALAGLLILSLLSTTMAHLLTGLQIPLGGSVSIYETTLWTFRWAEATLARAKRTAPSGVGAETVPGNSATAAQGPAIRRSRSRR